MDSVSLRDRPPRKHRRPSALALWTNLHDLATLRATHALDILNLRGNSPTDLIAHITHTHLA
ncbi:hypothetical protein F1D05_22510 [Kribbella qitaiheensis]|uniref:Uncharacterized protein n=1 Tax=Kribbella qitaiheensis TaxID=1544730 RepID=A0A7G6X1R0_9ACTN|nr:hypothetical protein [Kribbella qitaiheensis]QNE20175.1 hypothetical protein F1D05_22510 [Kribbella qitaiheensis]